MGSPVEFIRAVEQHICSEVSLGLITKDAACAKHLPMLLGRLRVLKNIPMPDVTACNSYLASSECLFAAEQRTEMAKLVQSLMAAGPKQSGSRAGYTMQSNKYLHKYLNSNMWATLLSDDAVKNKMQQLAVYMLKHLGIRLPDEFTKKLATVIVLVASGLDPTPQEAYDHVQEFGRIFDQKRSSMQHVQTLDAFPEDPSQFCAIYPTAFGQNMLPVDCRLASWLSCGRFGISCRLSPCCE